MCIYVGHCFDNVWHCFDNVLVMFFRVRLLATHVVIFPLTPHTFWMDCARQSTPRVRPRKTSVNPLNTIPKSTATGPRAKSETTNKSNK